MITFLIERACCHLFLAEPVFWTAIYHTVAEAETVVVHRLAQDGGRRPFRIEVGIAAGKSLKNLWGPPPTTLAVFRLAVGLVELVDIDERERSEGDVQVELVLEVQLVVVVIAQFWRQQDLAETCLSTTLTTNKRSLSSNKGTLLVNNRILFPSDPKLQAQYLFPRWECFIPRLGTFHSQGGNNCPSPYPFLSQMVNIY